MLCFEIVLIFLQKKTFFVLVKSIFYDNQDLDLAVFEYQEHVLPFKDLTFTFHFFNVMEYQIMVVIYK